MRRLPLALLVALCACPAPASGQETELPRGGTRIFPDFRVVAYAGTPGVPALGALGVGSLEGAVHRLRRQAVPTTAAGGRSCPRST